MLQKLIGHLTLARLSNSPTVVTNVLAGAALAGVLVPTQTVWLIAVAMVCFYTAGMYLNDLCDQAIDAVERPDRPLPSGLVSRTSAIGVTIALFATGYALLGLIGWRVAVSGLALVGLIIVYNVWHKTNPASPVVMALTRVMVYVTAFVAFSTEFNAAFVFAGVVMLFYIIGLTHIAKHETQASYRRYGPAALLLLPVLYIVHIPFGPYTFLVFFFAGWTLYSIRWVYRGRISAGISRLLAGISLLDALVLSSTGASNSVAIALMAVVLTSLLQGFIKGT
jgi:4-hydroxybenzoate polyprenyltransferase